MDHKEVHYEGWLIKSPPSKRIWRHRWRRRWFTLKQGEIPEQFCLEYYTDRNCRKLKGVIDLDQCEQVDCGLRLENRKQKFQYMFDIKTPKRTYYLAADTEADMRDWVNCICQVCHLHDTKQSSDIPEDNLSLLINSSVGLANTTAMTSLDSSSLADSDHPSATAASNNTANSIASASVYVNADCTHRSSALVGADVNGDEQHLLSEIQQQPPPSPATAIYLNHSALLAAQLQAQAAEPKCQTHKSTKVNSNGVVRKIPENLVLNSTPLPEVAEAEAQQQQQQQQQVGVQPSPALSTASGPYIPISECFSGSPKFPLDSSKPKTPLNNLDPRFYDAPRSQNIIGLNLSNVQSYSPKIPNCTLLQPQILPPPKSRQHRSDSDSEDVFTDDDEWTHPMPLRGNDESTERKPLRSESSIENEAFVVTFSQRFSKVPDSLVAADLQQEETELQSKDDKPETRHFGQDTLERLAKVLRNDIEENPHIQQQLTRCSINDNCSASSVVGPSVAETASTYGNIAQLQVHAIGTPTATSTPNLLAAGLQLESSNASKLNRSLTHKQNYSNAVDGNIFSYDFMTPKDCPPVNRKLKPKPTAADEKLSDETNATRSTIIPKKQFTLASANIKVTAALPTSDALPTTVNKPPSVDRNSKPSSFKAGSSATLASGAVSRRSSCTPLSSMTLPHELSEPSLLDVDSVGNNETRTLPRPIRNNNNSISIGGLIQHQRTASAAAAMQTTATTPSQALRAPNVLVAAKQAAEPVLQYFDLDVSNKPTLQQRPRLNTGDAVSPAQITRARTGSNVDLVVQARPAPAPSGVVYNIVDFVKTEAFQRIREERNKESEHATNSNLNNNK